MPAWLPMIFSPSFLSPSLSGGLTARSPDVQVEREWPVNTASFMSETCRVRDSSLMPKLKFGCRDLAPAYVRPVSNALATLQALHSYSAADGGWKASPVA